MRKIAFLLIIILFFNQYLFASFPVSTSTSVIATNDCDIILLESGEEILVNVIEITPDLIKYKKCDRENAPLISISKEDVFMIKYHDGAKEKINHVTASDGITSSKNTTNTTSKTYSAISIIFSCISIIFSLFINYIIGLLLLIPALIFGGLALAAKNDQS